MLQSLRIMFHMMTMLIGKQHLLNHHPPQY